MPQREKCLPVTFSSLKALREFLSSYDGSWRDLAWEFNGQVSVSTLRRITNGHYIPKRPQTLRALHLPDLITIPVCPKHGVVHISRRCPPDPARPCPKRRNWKGLALFLASLLATGKIVLH